MAPLISYFRDARKSLGITSKQIAEATGKKNMASHWFGTSQWQLPNEGDYNKLQALFARVAAEKTSARGTGKTTPPAGQHIQ
ncbi:putative dNA methylase [Escherichia coli 2875150]|nr:putative dNA methylase [Escherichia coli 2875150]